MRTRILALLFILISVSVMGGNPLISEPQGDPWTQQQLLDPAELARVLKNPKLPQPLVFSIGMQAVIKGSVEIGPVMRNQNLNLLKEKLTKLPKNALIVVYCGCCPFANCPNIRPAMALLKSMQFTNYKLLNLPQNIKVDWIDKDFPMND